MQNGIAQLLAQYLLQNFFHSKKQMAERIGVQYRALLMVCAGKSTNQNAIEMACIILRYCIQNGILLDQAIGFAC